MAMVRVNVSDEVSILVPENIEKIYKNFEPITTSVIKSSLTQGGVFIDIGANFGYFSVLASSVTGPTGSVFAVEASPMVYPLLLTNLHDFNNVNPYQIALGDHKGETAFFMTEDFVNSGVSSSPFTQTTSETVIPITTLDDLLSRAKGYDGRVDMIKCDVQGDEMAVLRGARHCIESNRNLKLIVEWAPAWMANAGSEPLHFPEFLSDLGFNKITIIDDWLMKTMTVEEMRTEFLKDETGKRFCNVLAEKE